MENYGINNIYPNTHISRVFDDKDIPLSELLGKTVKHEFLNEHISSPLPELSYAAAIKLGDNNSQVSLYNKFTNATIGTDDTDVRLDVFSNYASYKYFITITYNNLFKGIVGINIEDDEKVFKLLDTEGSEITSLDDISADDWFAIVNKALFSSGGGAGSWADLAAQELCNPEYIDSSCGRENLKEDLSILPKLDYGVVDLGIAILMSDIYVSNVKFDLPEGDAPLKMEINGVYKEYPKVYIEGQLGYGDFDPTTQSGEFVIIPNAMAIIGYENYMGWFNPTEELTSVKVFNELITNKIKFDYIDTNIEYEEQDPIVDLNIYYSQGSIDKMYSYINDFPDYVTYKGNLIQKSPLYQKRVTEGYVYPVAYAIGLGNDHGLYILQGNQIYFLGIDEDSEKQAILNDIKFLYKKKRDCIDESLLQNSDVFVLDACRVLYNYQSSKPIAVDKIGTWYSENNPVDIESYRASQNRNTSWPYTIIAFNPIYPIKVDTMDALIEIHIPVLYRRKFPHIYDSYFGNSTKKAKIKSLEWVDTMKYFWKGGTALTDVEIEALPAMDMIDTNLEICTNLTALSLVNILNALPQLSVSNPHTIQLGTVLLDKLTDEQKAIATNKGWTLI